MSLNLSWREIFKEAAISLGLDVLFHEVLTKQGPEVAARMFRRLTEHDRDGLFIFIAAMQDDVARENLLRRHKECKGKPGAEDRFVNLLTRLYLTIKDDPSKYWIFNYLGHLSDEDFDQALYFFENDVIMQWLDKAGKTIADAADFVKQTAQKANTTANNFFDQFLQ